MGYRSLFTLLNPAIFGIENFKLSEQIKVNFGIGYTIVPFGDMIDENIWLKFENGLNLKMYFRQFQNKENWFPAMGFSIVNFSLSNRMVLDFGLDIWKQPDLLDFETSSSKSGGALNLNLRYLFPTKSEELKAISIDLGFTTKTAGFLLEEIAHNRKIGARLGTSIWF